MNDNDLRALAAKLLKHYVADDNPVAKALVAQMPLDRAPARVIPLITAEERALLDQLGGAWASIHEGKTVALIAQGCGGDGDGDGDGDDDDGDDDDGDDDADSAAAAAAAAGINDGNINDSGLSSGFGAPGTGGINDGNINDSGLSGPADTADTADTAGLGGLGGLSAGDVSGLGSLGDAVASAGGLGGLAGLGGGLGEDAEATGMQGLAPGLSVGDLSTMSPETQAALAEALSNTPEEGDLVSDSPDIGNPYEGLAQNTHGLSQESFDSLAAQNAALGSLLSDLDAGLGKNDVSGEESKESLQLGPIGTVKGDIGMTIAGLDKGLQYDVLNGNLSLQQALDLAQQSSLTISGGKSVAGEKGDTVMGPVFGGPVNDVTTVDLVTEDQAAKDAAKTAVANTAANTTATTAAANTAATTAANAPAASKNGVTAPANSGMAATLDAARDAASKGLLQNFLDTYGKTAVVAGETNYAGNVAALGPAVMSELQAANATALSKFGSLTTADKSTVTDNNTITGNTTGNTTTGNTTTGNTTTGNTTGNTTTGNTTTGNTTDTTGNTTTGNTTTGNTTTGNTTDTTGNTTTGNITTGDTVDSVKDEKVGDTVVDDTKKTTDTVVDDTKKKTTDVVDDIKDVVKDTLAGGGTDTNSSTDTGGGTDTLPGGGTTIVKPKTQIIGGREYVGLDNANKYGSGAERVFFRPWTREVAAADGGYFDADQYFADGGLTTPTTTPAMPTMSSFPTMAYTDGQGPVGNIAQPPGVMPSDSVGFDAPTASPMAPAPSAAAPTMGALQQALGSRNTNASPTMAPVPQNPNVGYALGQSPLSTLRNS
jgi:hypothetical protein